MHGVLGEQASRTGIYISDVFSVVRVIRFLVSLWLLARLLLTTGRRIILLHTLGHMFPEDASGMCEY